LAKTELLINTSNPFLDVMKIQLTIHSFIHSFA